MNPARTAPKGAMAHIRLMATSDLHMNLTSFDYCSGRPDPSIGLTRTASLIAQARAEAAERGAQCLLFDNGDALQGAPLGDLALQDPGRAHPLMRAFSYLRYDAVGLGNHDFDFGLKTLDAVLHQAPCPVLCTNMTKLTPAKAPGFSHTAILDRIVRSGGAEWPIRIGVLSFLPPQTLIWDSHLLRGRVDVADIIDSARAALPELQRAGCDLVVALAHTGLGDATPRPLMENAAIPLAALDGIDIVVAGHTHQLLPPPRPCDNIDTDANGGKLYGKPVIMPGAAGSHLGVIDLTLMADPDGRWTVARSDCELRPIACRMPDGTLKSLAREDPGLVALLAEDHADTQTLLNQPVGHSQQSLHSYFSFIAPDRSLAIVAAAQAAAVRPHLDGTTAAGLPLLSAVSPGKFGARSGPQSFTDVPAGPLSLRHLEDLYVFPNDLQVVVVTGSQVIDWLEMSASLFHQIMPGAHEATLIDPDVPGHEFDVLYGLTYVIDLSKEARFHPDGTLRAVENRRTGQVLCNGNAIGPDQRFAVALNSFRAGGGGHFAALRDVHHAPLPAITVRDALRRYLSGDLSPDPLADGPQPWRFAPMPGTRVSIQTGPGAAKHLDEILGRGVEPRGIDDGGFLLLSVPL